LPLQRGRAFALQAKGRGRLFSSSVQLLSPGDPNLSHEAWQPRPADLLLANCCTEVQLPGSVGSGQRLEAVARCRCAQPMP